MVIENKRGQNITLGTIILIILGIVVLVVLIFGFTSGWSNLWEKLVGSGSGSNVDSVRTECELACSTQREYDYCSDSRTVKFGGGITETGSCFSLSGSDTSKAGIVSCNQIDCEGKTIPGYESNRPNGTVTSSGISPTRDSTAGITSESPTTPQD